MSLKELYHTGKGDFTSEILDLDTQSKAYISLAMNGSNYLNNVQLSLDAIIGINLKNNRYTFKENKAFINQLPLAFNGFIQLVDKGQLYDLSFDTPTSNFKNLLALVPQKFSGNLAKVTTAGNFNFNGKVNGLLSEETIPKFTIDIASSNAMFKYADLPKAVQNINISSKISNVTGNSNDTKIDVTKLSFTIDKDVFNAQGNIYNLVKNPTVNLTADGSINLANIAKVYPIDLQKNISGIVQANVNTNFDMNAVQSGNYEKINNKGTIQLNDFIYEGKELSHPFVIKKSKVTFNPKQVQLSSFTAKTGSSDMKVSGNLDNFYGFLFRKEELKGNFNLHSNFFKVADFISTAIDSSQTTQNKTATESIVKIPAFLNCSFTAKADKVVYDNLNLSKVSGALFLKNETVELKNLKMGIFGGNIGMNGTISTKEKTPTFSMDLGLKGLNISDSFSQIEMLSSIAPIANTIEGKFNSTINLSGNLTQEMTPDINSISGDLLGQLINSKVTPKNSKLLSTLSSEMKFLDLKKLNLNDVKAFLSFKDGKVQLKPFQVKYQDVKIDINGAHGFNQQMNYDLKFHLPAKYFGKEAASYLSKLSPKSAKKITTVPVTASLSGSFSKPNVTTDIRQATTNLVNQLVQQQKNDLISKGKSTLTSLLNGKNSKDSTKTKKVSTILNSLFGKKKKKKN